MPSDNRDRGTWAAWGVHLISEVESNASGLEELEKRVSVLERENSALRATISAENVVERLSDLRTQVDDFISEQEKLNTRSALVANVGAWVGATVVSAVVSAIVGWIFTHV